MVAAPGTPTVRVDRGQIEQVIMNLVVNAQDAMPQGGRIVIETGLVDLDQEYADSHAGVQPGQYVQLTVSDTGCGMTSEVREQIFAPFFTTKEKGKGTGLGLATAYGIVKQHGGHIWVYSEADQGTTFKIYLPAAEAAIAPQPVEAGEEEEHAPASAAVMVVEDNDMVRQLTVDVLTRRGYAVLEASGGTECLELIKGHVGPLDLLLTDVVMPEMNGKALYKKAVQLRPGLKVLYMSGYTENVIASRGVLDQGVNFIQKPFAPKNLAAKVREVLAS
jgi:CheY-like chemotaxis protein